MSKGRRFETQPRTQGYFRRRYPGQLDNFVLALRRTKLAVKNDLQTFDHGRSSLIKWIRYPKEVNQMERGQPDLNVVARL